MNRHKNPERRAALRKASHEAKPKSWTALGLALSMGPTLNAGVSEFLVRDIVRYNATRVFHAPLNWPDERAAPWVRIEGSIRNYSATLTGHLTRYLKSECSLMHYNAAAGLRECAARLENNEASRSVYLVIEETGPIHGCRMERGECWLGPDGGRDGVVIFKTDEGAWPEFRESTDRDTALLAALRAKTKAAHPFELHGSFVGYTTNRGEAAHPIEMEMNIAYGGLRTTKLIPDGELVTWADDIRTLTDLLLVASSDPAVKELLDAIRLDSAKDDEYFRLWYLRLWQALTDVGIHCKCKAVREHLKLLETQQRWKEMKLHRTAIAHWWTELVDYKMVADLHQFGVEVVEFIAHSVEE